MEAAQRPVDSVQGSFRALGGRERVRTNHEWRQTLFRGRGPRGRSQSLEPLAENRVARHARIFGQKNLSRDNSWQEIKTADGGRDSQP